MNMKKNIWIVLLVVFSVIFVFATVNFISIYLSGSFDADKYKTNDVSSTNTQSSQEENLPDNPINFNVLKEQNDDVYAWITLPDTKIDYPILQPQTEDDNFYLDRDIDKQKSRAGSIYTQRANKKDFSDPNTIIYGHNMANGNMFRALHKFKDKKFFEQNRYFYIYTPGNIYTYEIFAAYRYDDRHILNSFDFSNKQIFAGYLNSILSLTSNANIKSDVQVNADSKIVTLSTCYANSRPEYRYIVQGVLVKHERTK